MLFVNFAATLGTAVVFSAHDSTVAWSFFSAALLLTLIRFVKLKQLLADDFVKRLTDTLSSAKLPAE